jgi:hypothetical protein
MRRSLLALMLGLIVCAALAPLVEAGQCVQSCAGDTEDGACADDLCCSCCVHFRVDPPRAAGSAPGLSVTGRVAAPLFARPSPPGPREVLHVPKTSRS